MRIKVFGRHANVEADRPIQKVSTFRAEQLVSDNMAERLDDSDWSKGIKMLGSSKEQQYEARGSREQNGCLTAYEAQLNAECRSDTRSIGKLSQHYEIALENHILKGLKGMPRKCGVIAARVKTILSNPSHVR